MRRRRFLVGGASACIVLATGARAGSVAPETPQRKIVWILLRGALDSLHTVVPLFDPALESAREPLLRPLRNSLLRLDEGFALHGSLPTLHAWYGEGAFAPVVAVASPYRSRSHFEAQDVIESGFDPPRHDDGWLSRALAHHHGEGISIARSTLPSLRGQAAQKTWFPSRLPQPEETLYERLQQLYEADEILGSRLAEGIAMRQSVDLDPTAGRRPHRFEQLARACGELLLESPEASCAMLELGGWDTHVAQVPRLETRLRVLDRGLKSLREALGAQWKNTLLIVATEFGRTVAVNGTQGTDHGTASALLLAGGSLRGGRVLGQWPGLAREQLFEARDLRPTSDLRSWLAAALAQHWNLDTGSLADVFPAVSPRREQLLRTS